MQGFAVFFICVLGACLFSEGQGRCHPLDSEDRITTVPAGTKHVGRCIEYTCGEDGSWSALGCALSICENQRGSTPYDYSKPYPECCPRPICD